MRTPEAEPFLSSGDIVLVSRLGAPGFVQAAIRWRTRSRGEAPTIAHHVGLVVRGGPFSKAEVCESLVTGTRRRTLVDGYAGAVDRVAVFRPLNQTPLDITIIVKKMLTYEGRPYGVGKIVGHLLGLQGLIPGLESWPICSYSVARSEAAAGYYFAIGNRPPGSATPDDIADFCIGRPDRYHCVRPFAPVWPAEGPSG